MRRRGGLRRGLLQWWRGLRSAEEVVPEAGEAAVAPLSPVDDSFLPVTWVVREAFDLVMAGVEPGSAPREKLFEAFHGAVRSARPGAGEAAVTAQLAGTGWQWPEFERWEELFRQRRQWPAAWRHYPSLLATQHAPPRQVEEALPYFAYLERRDLLGTLSSSRQPAPIRVEEVEQAFLESFTWEEIAPVALERYRDFLDRCHVNREEDLCRLLAHHLRATVYNLIPFHQGQAVAGRGLLRYRWEVTDDGEPLASEYANRFNRGESERIPPYFPGDPSRLRLIRL